MDTFILIGGLILTFILINIIAHFYLKYKNKLFFTYIKDRKYILIKNVETEIEGYSKLGYKFTYRKANIIFLEGEIFILSFNNSIIQLTKSNESFPSVFYKYTYDSKLKVNDILEIKNTNLNIKVRLNFKYKDVDLHSIDKHL
ncbi:hypothetical protein [Chryseobacterium oncorhynchi]|uniref:Uncharacterized protein n=1 Tax=Chryseobacterium oncorhynchi TaxID=741074 RepID=A0A316X8R9_9FLAO|nr:hypothetical protein [Chryseobacterium oncorhynchi]PWN67210.1 hypothetical protein C1638_000990 [Chryseobacterium oncorhynchi]